MKNEITLLNQQIFILEQRQKKIISQIKQQAGDFLESLKPINLIKNYSNSLLKKVKIESSTISKLIGEGIDNVNETIQTKIKQSPITLFLKTVYSLRK